MARGKILFKEVIRTMYSGLPFDIKVVSYSSTKGTGGEILEYKGAKLAIDKNADEYRPGPSSADPIYETSTGNTRAPKHNIHKTMNIYLPSREIRKIRRVLIIEFNNQEVVI